MQSNDTFINRFPIPAMTQDHLKLIRIQEQGRHKLELEIDDFKMENAKQRKQISSLERERDRLAEEQLDLTSKIDNLMYEITTKKVQFQFFTEAFDNHRCAFLE